MNQYGSYGPRRSEIRKQKKLKDTLLNGAIVVAIVGIVFFSATLIFGGNDDAEPVAGDDLEEEEQNDSNEELQEEEEGLEQSGESEETSSEEANEETSEVDSSEGSSSNEDATEDESDTSGSEDLETPPGEVVGEGKWEPIGTVQEEPFAAVYDSNHVNWEEMVRALKYATGLEEDMITWHIGNGGDHESAVGIVSDGANSDTPYEVRLEWVTNEGWMPVYVKKLDENPRR